MFQTDWTKNQTEQKHGFGALNSEIELKFQTHDRDLFVEVQSQITISVL